MKFVSVRFGLAIFVLGLTLGACATNPTPPPTSAPTEVPPTVIAAAPTSAPTDVPPTSIPATATATAVPPTVVPTDTTVPPTATVAQTVAPTKTNTRVVTKAPPTATRPRPTATARPPTRAPTASAAQMGDNFSDAFDAPGILRAASSDICSLAYEGGQFHIRVNKQHYLCWAFYPRVYNNFALDVDVVMHSGEGSCGGGGSIVFGHQDNKNFSLFDVNRTCRGFTVSQLQNGGWTTLRPWDQGLRVGESPAEGVTVTHLRLVAQNGELQLFSNGELMDKIAAPGYQGGRVGIAGGTWGQDTHVSFDNLTIEALP